MEMPVTKDRQPPDNNLPPELRRLVAKILASGTSQLSDEEQLMIAQVFRTAAMTQEKRLIDVRDAISQAHLEYCFRLPAGRRR
jgi:hypothetical protein